LPQNFTKLGRCPHRFRPLPGLRSAMTGATSALAGRTPERDVAGGYLTARKVSRLTGARRMAAVSDAILSEFG
jgi:hypothetical protein